MVHIGLDRLEMFLLPLPIWDCQTAELPSSVHRNRGHKTVERSTSVSAALLTRRHIVMTSDGSNWVVPQRGIGAVP